MSLLDRLKRLINSPLAVDHKSCEDCFYYRYEESHPEYFKFCGSCLERKDKPNFHAKGEGR